VKKPQRRNGRWVGPAESCRKIVVIVIIMRNLLKSENSYPARHSKELIEKFSTGDLKGLAGGVVL